MKKNLTAGCNIRFEGHLGGRQEKFFAIIRRESRELLFCQVESALDVPLFFQKAHLNDDFPHRVILLQLIQCGLCDDRVFGLECLLGQCEEFLWRSLFVEHEALKGTERVGVAERGIKEADFAEDGILIRHHKNSPAHQTYRFWNIAFTGRDLRLL